MKIYYLLLIPLILFACKQPTREEKAKEAIKKYLSKTMHDFKSYEPVEYGKLDSTFTSYYTTERYDSLKKELKEAMNESKVYTDKLTYTSAYFSVLTGSSVNDQIK